MLVFNFFLFRVLPADPAKNLTRSNALTASQLAAINKTFGLGLPLPQQFWNYLVQTLHGNLGRSFVNQEPVSQLIGQRLWPTILLVGTSTVLSTIIGVWIGIRGAWNRGSTFDRTSTAICNTLYAMPDFWLGMVLLIAFASKIALFPTGGHAQPGGRRHRPGRPRPTCSGTSPCRASVLTLVYLAEYSLVMRSSLIDELGSDYLHHGPGQGAAGRPGPAAARGAQRAAAVDHADHAEPGLRDLRRDHHRGGVLLAGPRASCPTSR